MIPASLCKRAAPILAALLAALSAALLSAPAPVQAHATPIAVLELKATGAGRLIARWDYSSATGEGAPEAVFPRHCTLDGPKLDCSSRGLVGTLTVKDLGERFSAAVVRIARDGITESYTLTGAKPRLTLAADAAGGLGGRLCRSRHRAHPARRRPSAVRAGADLAGALAVDAGQDHHRVHDRPQSHAGGGNPGLGRRGGAAGQCRHRAQHRLRRRRGGEAAPGAGFTARHPWVVAFAFGLLHGLGFASALTDLGLTPDSIPWALLAFNVGVEIGQICFVLLILALFRAHHALALRLPRWGTDIPAYAVGAVAAHWFPGRFFVIVGL